MLILNTVPNDYRVMTTFEVNDFLDGTSYPDVIAVDDGRAFCVPAALPEGCIYEFGEHAEHAGCSMMMHFMDDNYIDTTYDTNLDDSIYDPEDMYCV